MSSGKRSITITIKPSAPPVGVTPIPLNIPIVPIVPTRATIPVKLKPKKKPIVVKLKPIPAKIKVKVVPITPINWNNIQKRAKGSKIDPKELALLWPKNKSERPTTWAPIDEFIQNLKAIKAQYGTEGAEFFTGSYVDSGDISTVGDYEAFLEKSKVQEFFRGMKEGEKRTYHLVDANFEVTSKLSAVEVLRAFLEEISGNKKEKYLVAGPDGTWIPLNAQKIANLNEAIGSFLSRPDKEMNTSDEELAAAFAAMLSITIWRVPKWGMGKGQRDESNSGFFPFYNTTDIDLTRQQIITGKEENPEKIMNDSCFIYALKMSNLFTEQELEKIRINCRTRDLSGKKIAEVARSFGFTIVQRRMDKRNKPETKTFNGGKDRVVQIGKMEEHFFLNEDIIDEDGTTKPAFDVIRRLLKENKFSSMPMMDCIEYTNEYYKNHEREIESLQLRHPTVVHNKNGKAIYKYFDYRPATQAVAGDETEENYDDLFDDDDSYDAKKSRWIKQKKLERELKKIQLYMERKIWVADFEAYFRKSANEKYTFDQLPILLIAECLGTFKEIQDGKPNISSYEWFKPSANDISTWFDMMGETNIIYFHNLGYDITQLLQILPKEAVVDEFIPAGTSVLSCKIKYKGKLIEFRCSFKLITLSIEKLAKAYLPDKQIIKEMCPYELYNSDTINTDRIDLQLVKDFYGDKFDEFMITAKDYCDEKSFFLHSYNSFYCKRDVEILRLSILKFYQMIKEDFKMVCFDYLTAPSFADAFFKKEGCFDGVYEFAGAPQIFMRRAVVGGRCMTRDNKPQHITGRILDQDNNSLYPAAMSRIDGYPVGIPDVLEPINENDYFNYDQIRGKYVYYIVEINIKNVKNKLSFPLLSVINQDGVRINTNEISGKMVIDRYALEDAIEHQGLQFDIIRGYGWTEVNNKINEVIKGVYATRVEYKKQKEYGPDGNPKQEICKLIMNASYGKTIMNAIDKDHRIVDDENMIKVINNNFQNITSIHKIGETDRWSISALRKTNNHFTRVQCGCAILSMSKRIMNEPMCLAEKIGAMIWYQDTDSMQITENDYFRLEKAFEEKYGRILTGKGLGQFSSDYKDELIGVEGYYLSKKLYAVRFNKPDKEGHLYHLRAKAIPQKLMKWEDYPVILSGGTVAKNLLECTPGIRTTYLQARIIKDFTRNISLKRYN